LYFLESGQKRLLTSLNPLLLVVLVTGIILVRTTAEPIMPVGFRRWDLLLTVMIYIGQRRSIHEGLLLVLFISHIFSLASSAPIGVFVIYSLIVFVGARALSYVIFADQWLSILAVIGAFSVVARIIMPLVASAFGHGWPVISWENLHPLGILLNTFLGLGIYWALSFLDAITLKAPPANIEIGS
jgi:hypothetical protein